MAAALNPLAHTATLPQAAAARVLACGAFLKNRACLLDGDRVVWSALHGDLGDPAACTGLHASVEALVALAGGAIQGVAHDLHPDFYSTRVALELAQRLGVPALAVQHHHAHVGVALAENLSVNGSDGSVIGLALDGVGLGADGTPWGGELLWARSTHQAHQWSRVGHLATLAQPGGDTAAREPWRLAAAVLFAAGRGDEIEARFAPVVGARAARLVHTQLQKRINCPTSSSAGRWFDAAAGALGLCVRQTFEAQAAIALQQLASEWLDVHPDWDAPWDGLDLHPVVLGLVDFAPDDLQARARGAAQFHLALAGGLATGAIQAAQRHGAGAVALVGGCFANAVLRHALRERVQGAGLQVLEPQAAGCGDEGLALGQAWIAACAVAASTFANDVLTTGCVLQSQTLEEEHLCA
jgi:hydrogenase maturation protein HypF